MPNHVKLKIIAQIKKLL